MSLHELKASALEVFAPRRLVAAAEVSLEQKRKRCTYVSLKFSRYPQLEGQFQSSFREKFYYANCRTLWAILVVLVCSALYESLTYWDTSSHTDDVVSWSLRGAGFVLCAAQLHLSLTRHYTAKVMQMSTSVFMTIVGCLMVANGIVLGYYDEVYGITLMLAFLATATMHSGMHFSFAMIPSWIVPIAYTAASLIISESVPLVAIFLLAGNLLYLHSSWASEMYLRRDFLLNLQQENEAERTAEILSLMLPPVVMAEIRQGTGFIAHLRPNASVLFTDIVSFTKLAARLEPEDVVALLNIVFSKFDQLTTVHCVYKVETIGDAYMACSGIVHRQDTHSQDLVECALAFQLASDGFFTPDGEPIKLRIGIHSGMVLAGVVGRKMPRYHLFGGTVTVAEEMESSGVPGRVCVSGDTYALVQSAFDFEQLPDHRLGSGRMIKRYLVATQEDFDTHSEALSQSRLGHMTTTPSRNFASSPSRAMSIGTTSHIGTPVSLLSQSPHWPNSRRQGAISPVSTLSCQVEEVNELESKHGHLSINVGGSDSATAPSRQRRILSTVLASESATPTSHPPTYRRGMPFTPQSIARCTHTPPARGQCRTCELDISADSQAGPPMIWV